MKNLLPQLVVLGEQAKSVLAERGTLRAKSPESEEPATAEQRRAEQGSEQERRDRRGRSTEDRWYHRSEKCTRNRASGATILIRGQER